MRSISFRGFMLCAALGLAITANAQETSVESEASIEAEASSPAAAPTEETAAMAPEAAAEAEAKTEADAATQATTATPATAPEAAAPTAAPAGDGKIAPPPQGKGQVVFFREKKFAGSAVRYKVREAAAELGKLGSGTYFIHVTEPGTHEYTVHSEAKDVLPLEIEPGETYYVIGSISMGFMVGHPNLSPSGQAAFDAMSAKLKPAN